MSAGADGAVWRDARALDGDEAPRVEAATPAQRSHKKGPKKPKASRRKKSPRHRCAWTREELVTLRAEWGEVKESTLRKKLGGRTWAAIAQKAYRLRLANPSQGMVSLHEAMRLSGMSLRPLRVVLAEAGVTPHNRVRTRVMGGREHYRNKVVHPDAVVEAVKAYLARRADLLTTEEIATAHGVTHHTARMAVNRLAAIRPVRRQYRSVSRVDAAVAVEQHRDRTRCWRVPGHCHVDACAARGVR